MDFFLISGAELCSLSEEEFRMCARCAGSTLYAQLEVWRNGKLLLLTRIVFRRVKFIAKCTPLIKYIILYKWCTLHFAYRVKSFRIQIIFRNKNVYLNHKS